MATYATPFRTSARPSYEMPKLGSAYYSCRAIRPRSKVWPIAPMGAASSPDRTTTRPRDGMPKRGSAYLSWRAIVTRSTLWPIVPLGADCKSERSTTLPRNGMSKRGRTALRCIRNRSGGGRGERECRCGRSPFAQKKKHLNGG